MKNINKSAEELANLYGIEIIDKPNSHLIELEDGTKISIDELDEETLNKYFGLDKLKGYQEHVVKKTKLK